MRPYYEQDGITIYHGDCRDVLPLLPPASFDLVVTSPPYNLGVTTGGGFPLGHYSGSQGVGSRGGRTGKWSGGALAKGYASYDHATPPADYEAWQKEKLTTLWGLITERGAIYYNHKP